MRNSAYQLAVVLLTAALSAAPAAADKSRGPAKLEDVRVYLVLRDNDKVIGELARYDARRVVVREDRTGKMITVHWAEMKPMGAYHLQKRLSDPNSAEVNFRLGWYCKQNGLYRDSQEHFSRALRLDPDLADRIRKVALGEFRGPVPLAVALRDPRELAELEQLESAGRLDTGHEHVNPDEVVKFGAIPAAYQKRALDQIRTFGDKVNEKIDTKLAAVETEHFVIFTDWPASEHRPLAAMFERIYSRLCAQFDVPDTGNIYLGKMPVFAYAGQDQFNRHATELDRKRLQPGTIAYVVRLTGHPYQHMVLFRYSNRLLLEKVATHECVHTFVNRYRTNRQVAGWLNEGLAEVMSGELLPAARVLERARAAARHAVRGPVDFGDFLNENYGSPEGKYYALCTSVVDYLLRKDPAQFLTMIDRIKAGSTTEAALKEVYRLDYAALAKAWEQWVKSNFRNP